MKKRNFRTIQTNGVRLNTVVEGDGPLVILLHGWPQCWYLWRNQIDPLVEAGFQVAVPNQRGYDSSDAPQEIEAYDILNLTGDVAGIADALGHETFIVVGHDWGAPLRPRHSGAAKRPFAVAVTIKVVNAVFCEGISSSLVWKRTAFRSDRVMG